MIDNIRLKKNIIIGFVAMILCLGVLATLQPHLATAQSSLACDGLTGATGNTNCGSSADDPEPGNLLKIGINILSIAAGIIAVIMIIIAGLKYITSQGDSGKLTTARNTVLYALIGLVIVALSQTIVYFVIEDRTTSTNQGDVQQSNRPI